MAGNDDSLPDSFTSQQQRAIPSLRRLAGQLEDRNFLSYHELGRRVRELFPKEERYGKQTIARLAPMLGMHPDVLSRCDLFAKMYTRAEARELANTSLEWSHMVVLLRLKDEAARQALQEEAIQGDWTVSQLEGELHRRRGYAKARGERLAQVHDYGPEHTLRELLRLGRAWLQEHGKAASLGQPPLPAQLEELPDESKTDQLAGLVRDAARVFADLARGARDLSRELAAVGRGWART
jgi:hypothetical protein